MKKNIIMLVLFISMTCAYADQTDPVSEAKALFNKGNYRKGVAILSKASRDNTISSLQRSNIMKSLAEFYEKLAGDLDKASAFYQKILNTDLAPAHPMKSLAQKEISRLESLKKKYNKQNEILEELRIVSGMQRDKNEIKQEIAQLENIVKKHPEYYKLSEVYYYLGADYRALKKYRKAYMSLNKSMELRPGIKYYLPVTVEAEMAYGEWIRSIANKGSWGTVGGLLVFTMIVFYVSRPWQWVKLRHLIVGLLMVPLWWAIFNFSHHWLAKRLNVTETVIQQLGVELPSFVNASPGSPGSAVASHLFLYGLIGVLGTFVFSIAMGRFKYRLTALLINAIFALLLFTSLVTIFYMRHCDNQSTFNSQTEKGLYYLKGNLYFGSYDPEPYILTNPKAYPDLNISNIENEDLHEWIVRYCPFETSNKKAHSQE